MDAEHHSYSARGVCALCGTACVQIRYSAKRVAFRRVHVDAYRSAYEGDLAGASHELERLEREYRTLPPRHLCTCSLQACPWFTRGGGACLECRRLDDLRRKQDVAVEIGRGKMALQHSPVPSVDSLDLAYAESRGMRTPRQVADFLNGERSA